MKLAFKRPNKGDDSLLRKISGLKAMMMLFYLTFIFSWLIFPGRLAVIAIAISGTLIILVDMRQVYGPQFYLHHIYWHLRWIWRWLKSPWRVLRSVLHFVNILLLGLFGSLKPDAFRARFQAADTRTERWYRAIRQWFGR